MELSESLSPNTANTDTHQITHQVRIITATSLFDGHDASINLIRRLLQERGAEVIHLGHNRSVLEIARAALEEGAQAIAISSYQGGHMEFFKYLKDLLNESCANYVKIFGGGGGVIVAEEKRTLEAYGIDQIFHPDDSRRLGLDGMIDLIMKAADYDIGQAQGHTVPETDCKYLAQAQDLRKIRTLGLALSKIEAHPDLPIDKIGTEVSLLKATKNRENPPVVLGVTGTGGAGKSSVIDELVQRFANVWPDRKIAVLCVDPSKRKTGGALLADRIRMNGLSRGNIFMRSVASRGSGSEISGALPSMVEFVKANDFDLIIAETSGIGQANVGITEVCDLSLYVMTSEFGAQSQLEKIDMIDYADFVAINKADHRGSQDALRDVRRQFRRSRKILNTSDHDLPVILTQAAQFNNIGISQLFSRICERLTSQRSELNWQLSEAFKKAFMSRPSDPIVPSHRQNYLAEIVATLRDYKKRAQEVREKTSLLGSIEEIRSQLELSSEFREELTQKSHELRSELSGEERRLLESWSSLNHVYSKEVLSYQVRGQEIRQKLVSHTLSGLPIRRVVFPTLKDWGDRMRFLLLENLPGYFPYTAGVFPLKRDSEDPSRQFAGEGTPERTNKRFHYLSRQEKFKRLSTAFDSVTLYGHDPDLRPDIFGKVGESGVNICTLEDMKALYGGFDLCDPNTSVSMTINGPAPMILAFFMNTAIDQQVERKEHDLNRTLTENEVKELIEWTLSQVRGTVQADILKEDQGQNTCIFTIDFALKMMGDIQEYFSQHNVRNFYSVSISGYHIAEAGANPISQLAFTLSNAFTFVEYYLGRGLKIDDFASNLSFFFSNGLDPEYSVIGRVARRIWAIAMRDLYHADSRSQKLKYHIQTSGRSLHAQEMDFNDIRTTLQALIATYDNCNSLHTNAFDEAVTTPTEHSVRRAQAIQLIINREFGMTKNENPLQGSYFMDELTECVEEAVLNEFLRINERGGVLGAMETQYQRSQIQQESMFYEKLKHSGELPIIGVNTFLNTSMTGHPPTPDLVRSSYEEKHLQLTRLIRFKQMHHEQAELELIKLKQAALNGENIFAALMSASRYCTLFQMTQALYEVGGQYRRNL